MDLLMNMKIQQTDVCEYVHVIPNRNSTSTYVRMGFLKEIDRRPKTTDGRLQKQYVHVHGCHHTETGVLLHGFSDCRPLDLVDVLWYAVGYQN